MFPVIDFPDPVTEPPGITTKFEEDTWLESSPSPGRVCTICAAPSNGYHFNAPSCSACAAFFRRTVTLNRNFVCAKNGSCRVNYAMRVICRACRYQKCISMGMERKAVQPRRDGNLGRRKISYAKSRQTPTTDKLTAIMESSGLSPDEPLSASYSSSISEEVQSPRNNPPTPFLNMAETTLDDLLKEERLHNERRKLLYCSHSSISNLLTSTPENDIPYGPEDLKELTFAGVQKDIRPQILVIYEWMRGWTHFAQLGTKDKKCFLRRCILYHTILDPAYLTMRLGLPNRFVMFNGMYTGISPDSLEGWKDEENISSEMKRKLYRPLLDRVVNEIVYPMRDIQLTFTEFLFLKALVSFKSASASDISPIIKRLMIDHIDLLFRALHHYYCTMGVPPEEIAQRTGGLVLLISSVYAVGMECLESHQKIQFFDLWQLDDLLLKLITREKNEQNE